MASPRRRKLSRGCPRGCRLRRATARLRLATTSMLLTFPRPSPRTRKPASLHAPDRNLKPEVARPVMQALTDQMLTWKVAENSSEVEVLMDTFISKVTEGGLRLVLDKILVPFGICPKVKTE